MYTSFASFNFKSADLEAEEKNYLDYHVPLARKLPGLRLYLTGRFRARTGVKPERYRAAILSFDDGKAAAEAMRSSPVAKELSDDGATHMTDVRWLTLDSEVIVPFDSRKVGENYFMMAAEFDLKPEGGDPEAAENRYRNRHTALARRLPGLRCYTIGRLKEGAGVKPDRYRMALLVFDTIDDLRAAYRSPVGVELVKDEEATITNARVHRLDIRVEV